MKVSRTDKTVASGIGHIYQQLRRCDSCKSGQNTYNSDSHVYEADMNS
jgi:hypothetical protein